MKSPLGSNLFAWLLSNFYHYPPQTDRVSVLRGPSKILAGEIVSPLIPLIVDQADPVGGIPDKKTKTG
jgi:hypothetical protein